MSAGQNTTSHAISRVLHLLALHPDVQQRLREEVTAARAERGDLDYDTLMNLPYLDAICRETLRCFPPVHQVVRTYVAAPIMYSNRLSYAINLFRTRKDVVMPLLWPIKSADGKSEIREIPVKKNTNVIVAIYNANRSTKIWGEDAEEWKPERWLKPLPKSVSDAHMPGVYASMLVLIAIIF